MIRVSVLYPYKEGARFDHDYYRDTHMPMVKATVGESLRAWSADKGLGGGRPGSPPPFVAAGHMVFDSVEAFQAAFGPHGKAIMADVPNYTDIAPTMQISEITAG
jgi:uncharacterized protein (TIGR02118 family)